MTQSINNINLDYELRFAHIDGHTDLDFVPGKNEIVTSGVDCEIRIWSLESENDSVQSSLSVQDVPYAILATSDRIIVGLADNTVKSYLMNEIGEEENLVCRFSSNITCLSLSTDQKLLAVGSADFDIKLINLNDQVSKTLQGHQGPILSLSIDTMKKYLTSSSCDGSIILCNDFENSPTLSRMCWEPATSEFLVIPRHGQVHFYCRDRWDEPSIQLKHPDMNELFSIVVFSNDGQFLAASTAQSMMAVWRMDSIRSKNFSPLSMLSNLTNPITSLKFNPNKSKQLCCTDNGGSLRIMMLKGSEIDRRNQNQLKSLEYSTKTNPPASKTMEDILADFEMENDDDFSFALQENNEYHCEKLQEKLENLTDSNELKIETTNDAEEIQDLDQNNDEFDIGAIKSKYEPLIFGNDLLSLVREKRVSPPIKQSPFQSGSTPVRYQRRFLVWNSVGIVYSHNEDGEKSIDVEFHDVTFHHSIHRVNLINYSMADLSNVCLVLASNGDDEMENLTAKLFCILLDISDQNKEWMIDLPKDEFFDCVATGQNFIAALTNLGFLRIWTVGGIQTMIRSIEGPAINLSAHDRFLMVLYHSASQHSQDGQSVNAFCLKVDHKGKTRAHPIPFPVPVALSPKSTIYWAGFTDEGSPCIVDSDGIIRLYKSHFGTGWFPICSTKLHANGKSDNFFIVGLSEIQAQVRCIFCKASKYPDTIPKPTLTLLPLKIPLCEPESSKTQQEEQCLRSRWLCSLLRRLSLDGYEIGEMLDDAEKLTINSLIKLFAIALGGERENLALEIARLLPNGQALEGAVHFEDELVQEEDEQNSDTEIEKLMTKKQADKIREILKDKNDQNSMISLVKDSDQEIFTSLKPKSMKKDEKKYENNEKESEDIENIIEDNVEASPIEKSNYENRTGHRNPFSVQKNKRKQIDSDEDDSTNADLNECDLIRIQENVDVANLINCDDDDDDDVGFKYFFEENRLRLFEEQTEEIEDEENLLIIAKAKYEQLTLKQKTKWRKKALKSEKISKKSKLIKTSNQSIEKSNKITNFFTKK
ncbi:WD repeat and HMG-box DNA-binding protein 1 [Sarcoptes scabiei]|uniref:WD repeat and HMG-box DNA-binding protein 1 n=1 Tax=Sarcoptes scabiei TaxID=52283 RepID=A0A834RK86_SARSC|nr:WD repeat and HMG-box DNA-binding protein 1 [Sarcoptes scabiei]